MPLPTLIALFASLHLTLAFSPAWTVSPAPAAAEEAAEIWAPHDVVIDQVPPRDWTPDQAVVLTIGIEPSDVADPRQGPLAVIEFAADGVPRPAVTVFFDRLMQMITRTPGWIVGERRWSRAQREQVVGRALGRVIAHEIGHFVLRTIDHASSGLMRPVHQADELVAPDRSRFPLWRPLTRAVTR
jgi:hypothetical protein